MLFSKFRNILEQKTVGAEISAQVFCHGHIIQETIDGVILVDRTETLYESVDAAIFNIKDAKMQEDIIQQIYQEAYDDISDNKVVGIIKEHRGDIRVTDTLVESYIELASSKIFSIDPVVSDIKKFNNLDRLIENRVDYVLDDGSKIVISEHTLNKINNIFNGHQDVIEYMRKSAHNFLNVLDQIEE